MPRVCAARGCTNRSNNTRNISFFKFPLRNEELTNKWVAALRRDKWHPTAFSFLCSAHFSDKYMYKTNDQRRLLASAVPTEFKVRDHFRKKVVKRPFLKRRLRAELRKVDQQPPIKKRSVPGDKAAAMPGQLSPHQSDGVSTKVVSDGADTLKDGADMLKDGEDQLMDGVDLLKDGADPLKDGADMLKDGADQLMDGVDLLKDGADPLKDGADPLMDGQDLDEGKELDIAAFLADGIGKVTDVGPDGCLLCGRKAVHGVSALQHMGSMRVPLRHRLDVLAAEGGLQPPSGSMLCGRCAHILNYADSIELELRLLRRTIAECVCTKHHLRLPLLGDELQCT